LGKVVLQKEWVDVAAAVRNAVETSRPLIDAAEHELVLDLPPEPLAVEADPLRLSQVVSNLLNNAAKYTAPGGRIRLVVEADGEWLVIRIRDNGAGIPIGMLSRIFQMFIQGDRDHKRSQGGLGIGLTLVKSLVEMHGGSVSAWSDGPGTGSEFVVRLPSVRRGTLPADTSVKNTATKPIPACSILVVDDNVDAANSLGDILRTGGHDVRVVFDGVSALGAIEARRPQLVFLDLGMPGVSGYEVAESIRKHPAYGDITLVAMTGWGREDDRWRTQMAGFDHHLLKPVDFSTLEELLRQVATETANSTDPP
jgi:CheY-like chemotaxis protein